MRDETLVTSEFSPRMQEKRTLVKMIKAAFSKNERPVTTAEFYRIGKMLGKGAFGRVNLAMHKVTDQLVAVKSMNKQYLNANPSATADPL